MTVMDHEPLNYYAPEIRRGMPELPRVRGGTWVVAIVLCVVQFPWAFFAFIAISSGHNGQPVDLARDSALESLLLLFTLPAIIIALRLAYVSSRWRRKAAFAGAVLMLLVSLCVLTLVGIHWYYEIYEYRNGNWGLF